MNPIYRADIIADFSPKTGSTSLGIRNVVSGFITVNNGTIANCSSMSPQTIAEASSSCSLLGGVYDSVTRRCDLTPGSGSMAQICKGLGGTFTGGKCQMPSAGSGGGGTARWHEAGRSAYLSGIQYDHDDVQKHRCSSASQYAGQSAGSPCSPVGAYCYQYVSSYFPVTVRWECQ